MGVESRRCPATCHAWARRCHILFFFDCCKLPTSTLCRCGI